MATHADDYQVILTHVRSWLPEQKLTLAEELLRSLRTFVAPNERIGISSEQVRGMAAGARPVPDDETVRGWLDEYRVGKHG